MFHICTTCDGLRQWASKLISKRTTKYDDYLRVCGVCGCALNAKVHIKKDVLLSVEKQLNDLPDTCWLKEPEDG